MTTVTAVSDAWRRHWSYLPKTNVLNVEMCFRRPMKQLRTIKNDICDSIIFVLNVALFSSKRLHLSSITINGIRGKHSQPILFRVPLHHQLPGTIERRDGQLHPILVQIPLHHQLSDLIEKSAGRNFALRRQWQAKIEKSWSFSIGNFVWDVTSHSTPRQKLHHTSKTFMKLKYSSASATMAIWARMHCQHIGRNANM